MSYTPATRRRHPDLAAGDALQLVNNSAVGGRSPQRPTLTDEGRAMTAHPYHAKLARVLDRMGGLYTVNDIMTKIAQGTMQSFVEGDSWAITKISQFPRAKVVEILAVVGRLDEARVLHDRVLTFAEKEGATLVQAYGRTGWIDDARRRGWKVKAKNYIYHREL